jgi:hypothetical protein
VYMEVGGCSTAVGVMDLYSIAYNGDYRRLKVRGSGWSLVKMSAFRKRLGLRDGSS